MLLDMQFRVYMRLILQNMQQYSTLSIQRIVSQSIYKQDLNFNRNEANLQKLIAYLPHLQPINQHLETVLELLKFYHFPITILFQPLFQKIRQLQSVSLAKIKKNLMNIAAYVNSLIRTMGLPEIPEINYFFVWGRAKKIYKLNLTVQERQLATFIIDVEKQKQNIKESIQCKNQWRLLKSWNKLKSIRMQRQPNVMQKHFIDKLMQLQPYIINQIRITYQFQHINSHLLQDKSINQITSDILKREEITKQTIQLSDQYTIKNNYQQIEAYPQQQSENQEQFRQININQKKLQTDSDESQDYQNQSCIIFNPMPRPKAQPLCCRTHFIADECLQYAQSLKIQYKHYSFPFVDRPGEHPGKLQKIKRLICGFLNAEGGIVYFGIKELIQSSKRCVVGYKINEKQKNQFNQCIYRLMELIKPDISKKCHIRWVPVKDSLHYCYIPGQYVAKIIIEKGACDQLYSYQHFKRNSKQQKFAIKTQNEVIVMEDAQQILRLFRNRLANPIQQTYQVHRGPCKEPQIGIQLNTVTKINNQKNDYYEDFPALPIVKTFKAELNIENKATKQIIIKDQPQNKKQNCQFIIKCNTQKTLSNYGLIWTQFMQMGDYIYLRLKRQSDIDKLPMQVQRRQIHSHLNFTYVTNQQCSIIYKIVKNYSSIVLKHVDRVKKCLYFDRSIDAAQFFIRMKNDYNIQLFFGQF